MAITLTETAIEILTSFGGHFGSYNEGEVVRVPAGETLPPTMLQNSRPFAGSAIPHTARTFSRAAWDAASRPRPEPARPVERDRAALRAMLGWTDGELDAAIAALGFPPPVGTRPRASSMLGKLASATQLDKMMGATWDTEPVSEPVWHDEPVQAWRATVEGLFRIKARR